MSDRIYKQWLTKLTARQLRNEEIRTYALLASLDTRRYPARVLQLVEEYFACREEAYQRGEALPLFGEQPELDKGRAERARVCDSTAYALGQSAAVDLGLEDHDFHPGPPDD